ncbi:MAG: SUMF1/EgtB/PvdO family nonheme iron enzyme [Treponema sp.]|nr:SUMF1/EgtB/PvdO family nonheme iron enzyme [Treponema sp.]
MKKNLTLIIFFLIFGIYNNFANSSSINSWILPFLQENLDDMILVENFEADGKKYNFKIGKYEVTQELYETVMGKNPSYFSKNPIDGENQKRRPVEFISWYDAINFCNQLTILIMGEDECCYTLSNIIYKTDDEKAANEKFIKEPPTYVLFIKSADVSINHNKKGFRLPTREEWLFAAKGLLVMEDKASALSVLILQNKRPFYLIKKAFPATQGKPKLEYKLLSSHYTRMV